MRKIFIIFPQLCRSYSILYLLLSADFVQSILLRGVELASCSSPLFFYVRTDGTAVWEVSCPAAR